MKAKTILNKAKGIFSKDKLWIKCVFIISFTIFFFLFAVLISMGINYLCQIEDLTTTLQVTQLISGLFTFICPALLLGLFFSRSPRKLLGLKEGNGLAILLACIAALICIPLINYLTTINEALIPESWNFAKTTEMKNDELIRQLLDNMGFGGMLFNLLIMAILPALGEELFFRGMLLGTLHKHIKNHHICIWATAVLFSLIHLQLGKFIPIMLMGAMFGYLRIWSKSIWLPVLAHFTNNSVIVIYYYLFKGETYGIDPENIGTSGTPWILAVFSVLLIAVLIDTRRLAKLGPNHLVLNEEETK